MPLSSYFPITYGFPDGNNLDSLAVIATGHPNPLIVEHAELPAPLSMSMLGVSSHLGSAVRFDSPDNRSYLRRQSHHVRPGNRAAVCHQVIQKPGVERKLFGVAMRNFHYCHMPRRFLTSASDTSPRVSILERISTMSVMKKMGGPPGPCPILRRPSYSLMSL